MAVCVCGCVQLSLAASLRLARGSATATTAGAGANSGAGAGAVGKPRTATGATGEVRFGSVSSATLFAGSEHCFHDASPSKKRCVCARQTEAAVHEAQVAAAGAGWLMIPWCAGL